MQEVHGGGDGADCADLAESLQLQADAKRLATLAAHLARRGFELVSRPGGAFIIQRWGYVAHCTDLAAAATMARRVGVQP